VTAAQSAGGISYAKPKWRPLESEGNLALLLLIPTFVLLGLFIAYPFLRGILLSVTNARVGVPGTFVGLDNFAKLANDPIFYAVVRNTVLYTAVTTVFKLALGLWLAILLNRDFKFKAITRAFILLPFIVPTVLACFAWKWMFDPTMSVLNWALWQLNLMSLGRPIQWLGDADMAMVSVIIINVWRGVPFFAISLMAGLQTISPDLQEAAAIDGAKPWQRFIYITWPLLLPVTMVVVLFSVIQTFADFQIVEVMTGGGPANATHVFATYAYQLAIRAGQLSQGAAISLAMFPILFMIVIFQLIYIRRVETR
jgi:multiple sugar transport system permease protein